MVQGGVPLFRSLLLESSKALLIQYSTNVLVLPTLDGWEDDIIFLYNFFIEDSAGDIVKETKEETREKRIYCILIY